MIECWGFLIYMSCSVPQAPPTDTFCQVASPIYWSTADTRATKEAVDMHNRKWKRLCANKAK
jgi:hypothetical protein